MLNLGQRHELRPPDLRLVQPLLDDRPACGWSRVRDTDLWQRNIKQFKASLLDEVLPQVEKNYRAQSDRKSRAIAGLSMGGGQTLNIAFNRPDLFRYVVMMSPAAGPQAEQQYPAIFKDPSGINKQFKLFWIGVGKDDTLVGPGVRALDPVLTKAGIKHTFTIGDGRHEWTVWRHNLNDVAPLLFR